MGFNSKYILSNEKLNSTSLTSFFFFFFFCDWTNILSPCFFSFKSNHDQLSLKSAARGKMGAEKQRYQTQFAVNKEEGIHQCVCHHVVSKYEKQTTFNMHRQLRICIFSPCSQMSPSEVILKLLNFWVALLYQFTSSVWGDRTDWMTCLETAPCVSSCFYS